MVRWSSLDSPVYDVQTRREETMVKSGCEIPYIRNVKCAESRVWSVKLRFVVVHARRVKVT